MPSIWELLTDAAIPAVAIVASTWIAVRLARSERQQAAEARAAEQRELTAMREAERRAAQTDRENARRDRIIEELVELFAMLIAAPPTAEDLPPTIRAVRAKLLTLGSVPSASALADWVGARTPDAAPARAADGTETETDTPSVADWADEMIGTITAWTRGETSDDDLRAGAAGERTT
ncbi:hypothetical protein [Microbacterium sp. 18062]|uniref:hypothetical protein n=1 Tax=Microbacterium sp. 18062 TaxID=2681410 RepID=UPI00135CA184|nr:hypothetical protein [Microbacterium sp. 18062]